MQGYHQYPDHKECNIPGLPEIMNGRYNLFRSLRSRRECLLQVDKIKKKHSKRALVRSHVNYSHVPFPMGT
jgi:hypothetical protein